jgi:hypothetical protein
MLQHRRREILGEMAKVGRACIACASSLYSTEYNARSASLAMRIDGSRLINCGVTPNGETVHLDLVDVVGKHVSLCLPFAQARSLTMTLPQLLTFALKAQTGDDSARYVFTLTRWRLEAAADSRLIITFGTPDGFEVSFCMTLQDCWELARALKADAEWAPNRIQTPIN